MELETITKLLNIPNYRVTRIIQSTPKNLHLAVEPIDPGTPVCSGCGEPHNVPVHSMGSITVQDLNICGRRVFLQVPKRKLLCDKDRKIRVEILDWIKGRFTARFAEEILRLTTVTSYRAAGWYLELDDETIQRMGRRRKTDVSESKVSRNKDMETRSSAGSVRIAF
ncbi:transposase family protein [Syntrophus aciditrophicus]|uniref:Transposase n=1 Tax=Syntrophus aciditrophicus (strain SB) TaxID=56780 RepID=Q2LSW8_SYNAS|nr:transposase family protein [Syntrophus aciditrophicus]ABC77178.1 transposase [Syntrophus aciditrophicus SB]